MKSIGAMLPAKSPKFLMILRHPWIILLPFLTKDTTGIWPVMPCKMPSQKVSLMIWTWRLLQPKATLSAFVMWGIQKWKMGFV